MSQLFSQTLSQTLQPACVQCGGTEYVLESGYYFCMECQLQSQVHNITLYKYSKISNIQVYNILCFSNCGKFIITRHWYYYFQDIREEVYDEFVVGTQRKKIAPTLKPQESVDPANEELGTVNSLFAAFLFNVFLLVNNLLNSFLQKVSLHLGKH